MDVSYLYVSPVSKNHNMHIRATSLLPPSLLTCPRNSTTALPLHPQNTYWAQFDEVTQKTVSLNYVERLWLSWYVYMQNDVLATGIMSFIMHEAVYFGRSIPWILVGYMPWLKKYKIQHVSTDLGGDCGRGEC